MTEDSSFKRFLLCKNAMQEQQIAMTFPAELKHMAYEFTLLPNVFISPSDDDLNRQPGFTKMLPRLEKEGSFLEVGSGCGCLGIAYYLTNSSMVKYLLLTDINSDAVENSRLNFERHGVTCGEARHSDLFNALEPGEKFDMIFWNAPFCFVAPEHGDMSMLDRSIGDVGYKTYNRYISEVLDHLEPGGRALLGTSAKFGCLDELQSIALLHNRQFTLIASKEAATATKPDFLLFEIKKK